MFPVSPARDSDFSDLHICYACSTYLTPTLGEFLKWHVFFQFCRARLGLPHVCFPRAVLNAQVCVVSPNPRVSPAVSSAPMESAMEGCAWVSHMEHWGWPLTNWGDYRLGIPSSSGWVSWWSQAAVNRVTSNWCHPRNQATVTCPLFLYTWYCGWGKKKDCLFDSVLHIWGSWKITDSLIFPMGEITTKKALLA